MDHLHHPHSLAAFVSPATFHSLPSPLPMDVLAAKHLASNAASSSFKHSLTLQDVQDQPNPIEFCYSLGAHHLLEQFTRALLQTLDPSPENAPRIMFLWTHRLSALVALDLAHIALAEVRNLDLFHHPLAPLHFQLAAARIAALANDPLRSLDLLAKVAAGRDLRSDPKEATALLACYRHMIAVAAWHLADPRLVSHLIAQLHSKLGGTGVVAATIPDKQARFQWWIETALARMAVTQLAHAEQAICALEQEIGSGAAHVQYVRATLLSCRGQHADAATAWTSLWNQVVGTARRVRAYEAAHSHSSSLALLAPHLPADLAPLTSPTSSDPATASLNANPATYAADHAWLSPLLLHTPHILRAISNNRLVSQVYHPSSPTLPESLHVDWMQAAKWGAFADAPVVGNLATWIEVSPNGSMAGEPVSEMDRKRDVLRVMGKASDAACVAALRMG